MRRHARHFESRSRTMPTRRIIRAIALLVLVGGSKLPTLLANDAFYDIPLSELKITSGELPKADATERLRLDGRWDAMVPRAVLDGPGEAYLEIDPDTLTAFRFRGEGDFTGAHLLIRAEAGKELSGGLSIPNSTPDRMTLVHYKVSASAARDSAREPFFHAKIIYYMRLANLPTAGGRAWFRHQFDDAVGQLNRLGRQRGGPDPLFRVTVDPIESESAYDLFSGGQ